MEHLRRESRLPTFGQDRALLRASSAERARWDLSWEIIAETVQFL
jgi:hypothetical protein